MPRTWIEEAFDFEYDYQPEEEVTRTYPGCAESVTITSVKLHGEDITEAMLNNAPQTFIQQLEDAALEDAWSRQPSIDDRADYLYEQWKDKQLEARA